MNEWPKAACGQLQRRQSDGQIETPRSGASRIKIEHPFDYLDSRSMRVARNDDVETAQLRIELQFLDVVQDVNGAPAQFYHLGVRIVSRPVADIDVPSDRSDRRNPAEPGNDLWPTDITGVDDMRHAGELLLNLRAQQAVGIRDDSNPKHCVSVARSQPE
jgi:hypothetical protein